MVAFYDTYLFLINRFTSDSEALSVDKQFTWGSGLLISPVIHKVIENYLFIFGTCFENIEEEKLKCVVLNYRNFM